MKEKLVWYCNNNDIRTEGYYLSILNAFDAILCQQNGLQHTSFRRITVYNWLANFNRTFDAPTRTQVESLKKILAQCGCDLEKSEKMQIEFCIKGF